MAQALAITTGKVPPLLLRAASGRATAMNHWPPLIPGRNQRCVVGGMFARRVPQLLHRLAHQFQSAGQGQRHAREQSVLVAPAAQKVAVGMKHLAALGGVRFAASQTDGVASQARAITCVPSPTCLTLHTPALPPLHTTKRMLSGTRQQ